MEGGVCFGSTLFALWKETPGDTQGGQEGKTDVCFPKRLCCVCGRKGPASKERELVEWQADRQTERDGQAEAGRKAPAE